KLAKVPVTVNVLPALTTKTPSFLKIPGTANVLPAQVARVPRLLSVTNAPEAKLRPFWMVKLPAAALVVKLARASLFEASTIRAAGPSNTIVAALVRTSAPANIRVPPIRYVPPVSVDPE